MADRREDELDRFFSTLAITSRKFPLSLQIKMKLRIQIEMSKFEEEWLEMKNKEK